MVSCPGDAPALASLSVSGTSYGNGVASPCIAAVIAALATQLSGRLCSHLHLQNNGTGDNDRGKDRGGHHAIIHGREGTPRPQQQQTRNCLIRLSHTFPQTKRILGIQSFAREHHDQNEILSSLIKTSQEEAKGSPHCFFGLPPTDDNPIAFVNIKARSAVQCASRVGLGIFTFYELDSSRLLSWRSI